jgi:hypothetical protein
MPFSLVAGWVALGSSTSAFEGLLSALVDEPPVPPGRYEIDRRSGR